MTSVLFLYCWSLISFRSLPFHAPAIRLSKLASAMPRRALTVPLTPAPPPGEAESSAVNSPVKRGAKRARTSSATDPQTPSSGAIKRSASLSARDVFPRDAVAPLPLPPGSRALKIITWNVNGLKALVSSKLSILQQLVDRHSPDVLCMQETKLQENMVGEYKDLLPGYAGFFSCSTVKKGYSGTALFLRRATIGTQHVESAGAPADAAGTATKKTKRQASLSSLWKGKQDGEAGGEGSDAKEAEGDQVKVPGEEQAAGPPLLEARSIAYDFEVNGRSHKGEGRTIVLETDSFYLVGCYVPNSGEGLKRLDYRVKEWDPDFREFLHQLFQRKPVIMTGDLNVGHLDLDIHNPTAKHIVKQAGLTPEERASFSTLLSGPFKDAFRFYYPNARGQFTYWSQRMFSRPVNHGLRLDYFICSENLFPTLAQVAEDREQVKMTEVTVASSTDVQVSSELLRSATREDTMPLPGIHDCYILHEDTVGCSDHCPVALVVRLS